MHKDHPEDIRILVIDDTDSVRSVLVRALLIAGYGKTSGYSTIRESLLREKYSQIHLVICDLQLRGDDIFEDGCEAITFFQSRWPHLKFLMISGGDPSDFIRCPPGIRIILKPTGLQEFKAIVYEVLFPQPPLPEL